VYRDHLITPALCYNMQRQTGITENN